MISKLDFLATVRVLLQGHSSHNEKSVLLCLILDVLSRHVKLSDQGRQRIEEDFANNDLFNVIDGLAVEFHEKVSKIMEYSVGHETKF